MIGKIKLKLTLLLIVFYCLSISVASPVSVSAKVSRSSISLSETVQYQLIVKNVKKIDRIDTSVFKDFHILQQSSSQNFQYINGEFASSIIKTYTLKPKAIGNAQILGPSVMIEGKKITPNPVNIQVLQAAQLSQQSQGNSSAQRANQKNNAQALSQNNNQKNSSDIFLISKVNKQKVYVGQELVYSLLLYRRVSLLSDISYRIPNFGNIIHEPLKRREDTITASHQGKRYYVQEIDRRKLYAYEPGTVTVSEAEAEIRLSFFMNNQLLRSNKFQIEVLPLPNRGKPNNFAGLVGKFDISSKLDKTVTIQNQPLAMKITVSGKGNIKQLNKLNFNASETFKIYQSNIDDKPLGDSKDNYQRVFEYIIVPKKPGNFQIPQFKMSYFDPGLNAYKMLATEAIEINVVEGTAGREKEVSDKIEILSKDLKYLKPLPKKLKNKPGLANTKLAYILIGLNILISLIWIFLMLQKRGLLKKVFFFLSSSPHEEAFKQLKDIQNNNEDEKIVGSQVHTIVTHYLAKVIDPSIKGLGNHELKVLLQKKGIPALQTKSIIHILERCSFLAYTPDADKQKEKEQLIKKTEQLLKELKKS